MELFFDVEDCLVYHEDTAVFPSEENSLGF